MQCRFRQEVDKEKKGNDKVPWEKLNLAVCASTSRPLDGTQVHMRGWPHYYIYIHPWCKYIQPDFKGAGRLFYMEIKTACSGLRKCFWASMVILNTQTWYCQLLPVSLLNCGSNQAFLIVPLLSQSCVGPGPRCLKKSVQNERICTKITAEDALLCTVWNDFTLCQNGLETHTRRGSIPVSLCADPCVLTCMYRDGWSSLNGCMLSWPTHEIDMDYWL